MTETATLRTIGGAIPKPDAWLKATGAAAYAGDVRLPGMLEAAVLRSPYPHARIVLIDGTAAESLTGVYAVVTAADQATDRIGRAIQDRFALARDRVTYVGEPVAAVAAVDPEIAQQALQLIQVEYEELPAVFDPEAALAEDAPVVHPELAEYQDASGRSRGGAARKGNVRARGKHEVGDVDAAFAEPGLVVYEATYRTPRQSHAFTEPHAAIAQVDPTGKVTIWASMKAPFRGRVHVARSLGIPISRVRFISPVIGGDFGGKGAAFIEPIVALLARKSGRPVRLALSRWEELTAMTSRPSCVVRMKMGARPDGTITTLDAEMLYDLGAVDDSGSGYNSGVALVGAYRVPNVRITACSVYTNTSPSGHVRAPSGPQAAFALESHLDSLARRLGMDPLEFRAHNALADGDVVPSGHGVLHNSGLQACIQRAREWMAEELGPRQPNQGIGVALGLWALHPNAPGQAAATVHVDVEGYATVTSGVTDQGGGQWSLAASVASEVLGLPVDRVNVIAADTEATPFEHGTGGSGTTYRVGNIVRQAAEDARQQLLQAAATRLPATVDELDLADSEVFVRSDPSQRISIANAAHAAMGLPAGAVMGSSRPGREREVLETAHEREELVDAPSFAVHVAQVQVDPETGNVDVLRYYTVQDVGRALNSLACKGQIEGGVVFGLGYALSEELISAEGTNLNANLWEYLIPTAPHVPDLTVELVEVPSTYGPYGAKGVGETPCIPVAAAIANAVEDAIGARITQAPLTPERVRAATKPGA
jgi:CO/xanthine dehydrogenase Mo-binding subunit